VKITRFGHASVRLEADVGGKATRIYIDPFILPPKPAPADLVLFTHTHHDHCADPSKILAPHTKTLGCNCQYAKQAIVPGQTVDLGIAKVHAVHAYNPAKEFHPRGAGAGLIVEFGGARIYHAGDTDKIPEMAGKDYSCDVALLPIGGHYTMSLGEAAEAAKLIKPKLAIPMHYDTFDAIKADPKEFAKLLAGSGIEVRII
jgi:L-ascorbate metabolism protein UlaG (beta-lactamase superfamily)